MTEQLQLGTQAGYTLDEVLIYGQGVERPFCCPVHGDSHASASVNVLKGVWFCHRCQARGRVDDKRAPSSEDLLALMKPEEQARIHPEEWLALFTPPEYWAARFPRWVCELLQLGHDPFTDAATFPVRTPAGKLAGVGRRLPAGDLRYLYPRNWSAASALAGASCDYDRHRDVVVLVEGIADAAALHEVGVDAFGCYGAGLHHPQLEFILRMTPRLVVSAFDADDAGQRANERTVELVSEHTEVVALNWNAYGGGKDPAELPDAARVSLLAEAVAGSTYAAAKPAMYHWIENVHTWKQAHTWKE